MDLLRFTTAGSVDDGKSTLIGRLLFDSKAIFQDQLEALERAQTIRGEQGINLAFVTDGLRAEREQGITIDVAYRYFHTPKRKFIIADTPGHVQFTRNMVTGASTANAAIIIVDARHGITEQTKRHAYIASLLRIPHFIVCINKMDLMGFSEKVFTSIQGSFLSFAHTLDIHDLWVVPMSALHGDNVVNPSVHMHWYKGATLLNLLENINIFNDSNQIAPRFSVQLVVRANTKATPPYQGFAGRMASGTFSVGDRIKVWPGGAISTIKSIESGEKLLPSATASQSVVITLTDNLNIGRGSLMVRAENGIRCGENLTMMLCWLSEKPLMLHSVYFLRHCSSETSCRITEVKFKINISTLEKDYTDATIGFNDIGAVSLATTSTLFFDSYRSNRITGSLILIDVDTNVTVGAGMII